MNDFLTKLKNSMNTNEPTEEPIQDPVEGISMELTSVQSVEEEKSEKPEKKKAVKKTKKKKGKKIEKIELEEQEEKPKEKLEKSKEKLDDLFESPEGELTVDVYQKDKELIIQSAIAGIEAEDLDIAIEDDLLIIKGKRERSFAEENENYFFQECYWGRFKREILLPVEVDSSKINAKFEKGILTIRVPIVERQHKTKISIE